MHWFCPANDTATIDKVLVKSEDSEIWRDDVEAFATDYRCRRKGFSDCLDFFAYDGDNVVQILEFLKKGIDRNLGRCDQCIVKYHKTKNHWLENIEA